MELFSIPSPQQALDVAKTGLYLLSVLTVASVVAYIFVEIAVSQHQHNKRAIKQRK